MMTEIFSGLWINSEEVLHIQEVSGYIERFWDNSSCEDHPEIEHNINGHTEYKMTLVSFIGDTPNHLYIPGHMASSIAKKLIGGIYG